MDEFGVISQAERQSTTASQWVSSRKETNNVFQNLQAQTPPTLRQAPRWEAEADLVNGRKVYNVRFYSLSIIQSWKKQRVGGNEDKSERKGREGEQEAT
ncbi:hypothetical protein NQZ68_018803 [Dissostichus eleginoides]|nr:hypothetical protein NQZ68_018803 [Dissostichus eleginoides]